MATDVQVPALGESITEGTLAQWLKKPGEAVAADEPIASLETDKVSVEVPSPVAGVLTEQLVQEGDEVAVGAVIARIDQNATAGAAPQASPAQAAAAATTNPAGAGETPALARRCRSRAGQSRRRAAGRDRSDAFAGCSPRGARISRRPDQHPRFGQGRPPDQGRRDRRRAGEKSSPAQAGAQAPEAKTLAPEAKAPPPGPRPAPGNVGERKEERVKMTRLRQTIARRLKEAQNTAAMLTTFNDVDMSAVIDARSRYKDLFEKKHGIRLGFMGFFVKACALAAKDVPSVNASLEGDEIVYHDYLDVSVAVSAPKGLVVPVVRDADRLSFADIEKTIAAFGKKAKEGTLTADDMAGGTFTISNGGVFGSLLSTPIINPPQSAVLGMHRIEERPVVKDGQIVARPMMYLALSYDHRLIDGREAVTFLVRVKEAIEDPTRLLIDL